MDQPYPEQPARRQASSSEQEEHVKPAIFRPGVGNLFSRKRSTQQLMKISQKEFNIGNTIFDFQSSEWFASHRLTKSRLISPNMYVKAINAMPCYKMLTREELRIAYYERLNQLGVDIKEVESMPAKPLMQQYNFVGKIDREALSTVLDDIAPPCSECSKPRKMFCLESCCSGESLFCSACEASNHFLHRTNDLTLLFLNKGIIGNFEAKRHATMQSLTKCLESHINECSKIVAAHLKFIDSLTADIREIENKKANCGEYWHDLAYSVVQKYLKRTIDKQDASEQFLQSLKKLNVSMDVRDIWNGKELYPVLEAEIDSQMRQYQQTRIGIDDNIRNLMVGGTKIETVEQLVVATSFEKYFDNSRIILPERMIHDSKRSRAVDTDAVSEAFGDVDRLKVYSSLQKELTTAWPLSERLKELSICGIQRQFPPALKSLTIVLLKRKSSSEEDDSEEDKNQGKKHAELGRFPLSLQKLHVYLNEREFLLNFDYLTNLKQLKIADTSIQKKGELKRLLQFAIRNQMYTFEIGNLRFKSQGPIVWRENSIAYQRKLAQIMAIQRDKILRCASMPFLENILEVCEDLWETDLATFTKPSSPKNSLFGGFFGKPLS